MSKDFLTDSNSNKKELDYRKSFYDLYKKNPLPEKEILKNLGLFMNRQLLTRLLFMNDIYQKIIDLNGIIIEFGVRWGQNMALFESFRGIYEPYNYNRKIIGFDTFEGFEEPSKKDGDSKIIKKGAYGTTKNYEEYLKNILEYHEKESPISHIRKFNIIKGNAIIELKKYLDENPQTIIAMAYFDFDIYEPTAKCLEMIIPYLTKGCIIGFDELNYKTFQGETIALREILGTNNYRINRSKYSGLESYIEF